MLMSFAAVGRVQATVRHEHGDKIRVVALRQKGECRYV